MVMLLTVLKYAFEKQLCFKIRIHQFFFRVEKEIKEYTGNLFR